MKMILTASATTLALLMTLPASARPPELEQAALGPVGPEARIERMAERLDLSEAQQAEIRAILDAQAERRREARAAVMEEIDAVLTEAQRDLRDQQRARMLERRIDRLAQRIDLTADQQAELIEGLSEPSVLAQPDRTAIRDQLAAVLSDEQLTELESWRLGRGHQRDHRCRGGSPR